MIITRLLEKLQEKIWQATNKQALSRKKKKLVCRSDLMNEKQIMKIGEGSVRESIRQRKKSLSIPGEDQSVFGCLICAERMAKH